MSNNRSKTKVAMVNLTNQKVKKVEKVLDKVQALNKIHLVQIVLKAVLVNPILMEKNQKKI